jgi:hypothetical protein
MTETIQDGTDPILTSASGLFLAKLVTREPKALAARVPNTSIQALLLNLGHRHSHSQIVAPRPYGSRNFTG